MVLEFKCKRGNPTFAQKDTHSLVDQAFNFACKHKAIRNKRGKLIKYFGYHVIRHQHTSPDDGDTSVDGVLVSTREYLDFLKFHSPLLMSVSQKWQIPPTNKEEQQKELASVLFGK